jgi:hypothetical protein
MSRNVNSKISSLVDNFFFKVGIFDFFTEFWDTLTNFPVFSLFLLHLSIKKEIQASKPGGICDQLW